jgi:adenylate cyclase
MSEIRFGHFVVRPRERLLLLDGESCPIGSRAFDVLLALVERRDRVVSKNELLDLAWPGLVVEENNLAVQISTLRKVLGAHAIVTVTGRGYQFALAGDTPVATAAPASAPVGTERMPRRLAAVACAGVHRWADVVEADGALAVRAWRSVRGSIIEANLRHFGGDAVEITAERTLIVFGSAVDAVAWSLDVQERLAHAPEEDGTRDLRMQVGVVAEDVIVDQGKLVGDVFHIAERLQRSAAPGEVLVTDVVRDFVWNRLPASFAFAGEQQPSNFGRPVKVFRTSARATRAAPPAVSPRLMWDYRPTVAVLPFDCGAVDDSYFGDGITEEIITALSMNHSLFVIARNSTLRFRGAAQATELVASELGVRYVMTGAVRRFANTLRIHVELTDCEVSRVIWSEHYEGGDEDLFSFQSQIAARIAAAIDPRVQEAELDRVLHRPTASFTAYECMLRGISLEFGADDGDFEKAGDFFRRATELDPRYAQAHARLGWWHGLRVGEGRTGSLEEDKHSALTLLQRGMELDGRDAWILTAFAHLQSFLDKRYASAMELFDEALQLNPNCAWAWARSGTTLAYTGHGEEALERVRNAMRLSPFDQQSFSFCTTNGIACVVVGRHDEAVAWLSRARRLNPRYRAAARMLIAAHSLAGEAAEARELAREFLLAEPQFRLAAFGHWYPLQSPYLDRVLDGLRSAGLPE